MLTLHKFKNHFVVTWITPKNPSVKGFQQKMNPKKVPKGSISNTSNSLWFNILNKPHSLLDFFFVAVAMSLGHLCHVLQTGDWIVPAEIPHGGIFSNNYARVVNRRVSCAPAVSHVKLKPPNISFMSQVYLNKLMQPCTCRHGPVTQFM